MSFFLQFSGPTSGLRAVRILHDLGIAGKKLVAKVDAKNKLLLDNYQEEEEERNSGNSKECEAHEKKDDDNAVESIERIMSEYKAEIDNYETIQGLYHIDINSIFLLSGIFYFLLSSFNVYRAKE